jgi:hypothetical protein
VLSGCEWSKNLLAPACACLRLLAAPVMLLLLLPPLPAGLYINLQVQLAAS